MKFITVEAFLLPKNIKDSSEYADVQGSFRSHSFAVDHIVDFGETQIAGCAILTTSVGDTFFVKGAASRILDATQN